MRTRVTNKDRILDALDAPLGDLEIRACWLGLEQSELKYNQKIDYIMNQWNVSKATVEKALYSDKVICD